MNENLWGRVKISGHSIKFGRISYAFSDSFKSYGFISGALNPEAS